MKALEEMDEGERLALLEGVHRDRVGTEGAFAYCATEWTMEDRHGRKRATGMWRLSFVEMDEPGHFPITEDLFLGSKHAMEARAAALNLQRLGLSSHEAAHIIASTMARLR